MGVLAIPLLGQTLFRGIAGDDWHTAANWTGGAIPGSNETAVLGSTAALAATNAVARIRRGKTGSVATVSLGKRAASSGGLTVDGGTLSLVSPSTSYVGEMGSGELIVTNRGVLEGGAIMVAFEKASRGALRILEGGTLRNPSSPLVVAMKGLGALHVSGGTLDSPGQGITGPSFANGQADILFDNGAIVTARNFLLANVGENSRAGVTVRGNSSVVNLGNLTMGGKSGVLGTVTFESGSWMQKGAMYVGNKKGSTGQIVISSGGFQPQSEVNIGANSGTFGYLMVTNTTLVWTNASAVVRAGQSGTGTLEVIDSTMSARGDLHIGTFASATGSARFVDSSVTNRGAVTVGNIAGSGGNIVQTGGSLTVPGIFKLAASGTGAYWATNAVFDGQQVWIASGNVAAVGHAELAGTQRMFRVSNKLELGKLGSGTITNRVARYAGGIDLASATTLTIGNGGIHIAFEENPAALGMYWGLRWAGYRVDELEALRSGTPARLAWDVSRIDPYYQKNVGIYYDGDFTYVGIPVKRFAPKPTFIIVQ